MPELEAVEAGPTSQIIPAIIAAAQEIGFIGKEFNQQLGYDVRGWETILNRLSPILLSCGLIVTVDDLEVTHYESNGLPKVGIKCQCTLWHESGETITQTVHASHAEWVRRRGGDLTSPNNNPEGAARTYALRDFLCRILLIPTEGTPEISDGEISTDPGPELPPISQAVVSVCATLTPDQKSEMREWAFSNDIGTKPEMWTDAQANALADWLTVKKQEW
ncbi:MAG: ERF family protein [Chloroflexota bacterium]|nr:ERF family protein [Chloroflexota bacterium]